MQQQQQQPGPALQQSNGPPSPGIPVQVAQLHLRMHEDFHKQKSSRRQNANSDATLPWPKRWLGSRQWRQQQGRGAGLWESSFDGPAATAGTGLTGAYTTSVVHKVSDKVTCTHQLVLTANTTGAASVGGGATAPSTSTSAVAASAANKAVGSWATKKDGKRAKLVGDMANAPMKLMWLLNPRETLFQWAQARSEDAERLKRKKQKKERRQKKKAAAKKLKAMGLPPAAEEDEELAQQLQDALVGTSATAVPGEATAATANDKAKVKGKGKGKGKADSAKNGVPAGKSLKQDVEVAVPAASSSSVPTKALQSVHEEVVATSSATGHRLVTQYGRIWVPQQTPHGEEESMASAGDGAIVVLGMRVDDNTSKQHSGTVAPPNSVAGSGYGCHPGASQDSDYDQFQSNVSAIVVGIAGPSMA
ncbi:hypothetical protein SCUCBS95973_001975 [Sporothrix curviconia]|uniref:Uncharacterized protein n=1 Tax=Sporothrix curviconia TaxID=1260050 RepID=A0ABP0B350_9PEZI